MREFNSCSETSYHRTSAQGFAVCWCLASIEHCRSSRLDAVHPHANTDQASQVGIATLGLIYSTNDANDLALLRPGFVTVPDLSTIITNKVISSSSQVQLALQYTANT